VISIGRVFCHFADLVHATMERNSVRSLLPLPVPDVAASFLPACVTQQGWLIKAAKRSAPFEHHLSSSSHHRQLYDRTADLTIDTSGSTALGANVRRSHLLLAGRASTVLVVYSILLTTNTLALSSHFSSHFLYLNHGYSSAAIPHTSQTLYDMSCHV
jgi:hypothetical protein